MKTLELYKFIEEHNIEYHWHDDDVIMFVNCRDIEEFNKLLPNTIYDDDGIESIMKDGYFCFWMRQICEYCDIEIEPVFDKKDSL